jgi:hypothetical protein
VSARTLRSYRKALSSFLVYLSAVGIAFPRTAEAIDAEASEYINYLYQNGDSLTEAGHFVSALKRFVPQMRRCLHLSSQLYSNWSRTIVPSRATPFTLPILRGMAAAAVKGGRPDVAAVLLIGFSCFLRTGEMVALKVGDVKVFSNGSYLVRLPATKTSARKRAMESVFTEDSRLCGILSSLLSGREPSERILRCSVFEFRKYFQELLELLGIGNSGFAPYSIRRGGATAFFLKTHSLDATVLRSAGKMYGPREFTLTMQQLHLFPLPCLRVPEPFSMPWEVSCERPCYSTCVSAIIVVCRSEL